MTTHREVTIRCDGTSCEASTYEVPFPMVGQAREAAGKLGWELGRWCDLCPRCVADLKQWAESGPKGEQ